MWVVEGGSIIVAVNYDSPDYYVCCTFQDDENTEKARQALSEERADAVAGYLIQLGVRDKYHVFTQGFGGRVPVASNKTEEGKAKNRRVEITILDK